MPKANKFTKAQERKIHEVGKKIENAREAQRLSIRAAANRTRTPKGHLTEFTWRRVERGSVQTGLGEMTYRPSPMTLMAIAEVVGLDGEALCRELDLVPPPAAAPAVSGTARTKRIDQIERDLELLLEEIRKLR